MHDPTSRPKAARSSLQLVLLVCSALLFGAAACDTPSGTPRPSASLLELDFTPQPTITPPSTPGGSAAPTLVSWPIGWDVAFCELMTDAVVAQELLVDIERAMGEDALRDARLLAHELSLIATHAGELVPDVPDWQPAQDALADLATLMELDAQAAAEYLTYFQNERRPALRRARAARDEVASQLPGANDNLQVLADLGISCPGTPLQLESP